MIKLLLGITFFASISSFAYAKRPFERSFKLEFNSANWERRHSCKNSTSYGGMEPRACSERGVKCRVIRTNGQQQQLSTYEVCTPYSKIISYSVNKEDSLYVGKMDCKKAVGTLSVYDNIGEGYYGRKPFIVTKKFSTSKLDECKLNTDKLKNASKNPYTLTINFQDKTFEITYE
ncbi:MAG: hypothetical protein HON90_11310 [Halobacteriovoraceae bacterium]|jgi:hypothetical protein|nr:hypothetical protein [Halobacteriovoraceae bacterium]